MDTLLNRHHPKRIIGIAIAICILLFGIYYILGVGSLFFFLPIGLVSICTWLVSSFIRSTQGCNNRVSVYKKSEHKIRVTLTNNENRSRNRLQNGEKSFLISTSKRHFEIESMPTINHSLETSVFEPRQRPTNHDNALISNSSGFYAQSPLSPQEWSAVTSPGFSSRIVRTVEHDPPLREVSTPNGRSYNLSPFLSSPHRNLALGEIPASSKWRSLGLASAPVRFSSAQSSNRNISMGLHRREDDVGRLFLRIAPIDKITANSSTPEIIENNVAQTISSPGLGGTKSASITDKLSHLWSSANNSAYEASTSSASLTTPTVTESHNRKRNRNSDQNSDSSPPLKSSAVASNFPLPAEDMKNIKRLKFLNPPDETMSNSSLASVPLTNYHNTTDMSSESILEQMNQTEKRFLPDDDRSTVRPNVKRQKSNGTSTTPSTTRALRSSTPPTYRKRKVSPHHLTVLNEEETETKEKAPRLCNCSDCYKEAAGIPLLRKKPTIPSCSSTPTTAITSPITTPIPISIPQPSKKRVTFISQQSQKSVDASDKGKLSKEDKKHDEKSTNESTLPVAVEDKDLFTKTKENLSTLPVINKEQYFADKKRKEGRLYKILELNQKTTKDYSTAAASQLSESFIDTRQSNQSQVQVSGSEEILPSGSGVSQPPASTFLSGQQPQTSSQSRAFSTPGSGSQSTPKLLPEASVSPSTATPGLSASELLSEKVPEKNVQNPVKFEFSAPKPPVISSGQVSISASESPNTLTGASLLPNSSIGAGAVGNLSPKSTLPSLNTTSPLPPFSFGTSPPVSNSTSVTTTSTLTPFQTVSKTLSTPSTTVSQVQFGISSTSTVTATSSSSTLPSSFQFRTTTTANTQSPSAGSDGVTTQASTLFMGSPKSASSPASIPFQFGTLAASKTQQQISGFGGINPAQTTPLSLPTAKPVAETSKQQPGLFNLPVTSSQPAVTTASKETTTISVTTATDIFTKTKTGASPFPTAGTLETLTAKSSLPSFGTSSIPSLNFGSTQQLQPLPVITNSTLTPVTTSMKSPFQTSTQNSPASPATFTSTTPSIQFGIGSGVSSTSGSKPFQFGAITTANTQSPGSGFGGLGSQQSTVFSGTATTVSPFGRLATNAATFGTAISPSFGTPPTTTISSTPFGTATSSNAFGIKTTTATPFGTETASTTFGAGTTSSANTFGTVTASTAFGTPSASSVFGTQIASSTFGTPATTGSTPFGTTTATPSTPFQFGTAAPTNTQLQSPSFGGMGAVQSTPLIFGMSGTPTQAASSPFQFGVTTTTANTQLTGTGFGSMGTQPSFSGITIPGSAFGSTTMPASPFGTTTVTPSSPFQFGAAGSTNTQLQSPGFGGLGPTQPQPSIFNLGGVSTPSSPFQFGATAPAQPQNPNFGGMGMSSPQSPMFTLGGGMPTGSPTSAPRRNQARGRRYR